MKDQACSWADEAAVFHTKTFQDKKINVLLPILRVKGTINRNMESYTSLEKDEHVKENLQKKELSRIYTKSLPGAFTVKI